MLVHSEDSNAFVLTGGLTLYKLLKITHFLRHRGTQSFLHYHNCSAFFANFFFVHCTIYITVGKSWYYYPLQIVTIFCALIQYLLLKEIRPIVFKNEFLGKTKKMEKEVSSFWRNIWISTFKLQLPCNAILEFYFFFLTKDIHGLFLQHAFSGAILFFVCHEVLSFQCARACVKSVSSAGFYVLSLSLSPFFYLSLTLFFWALTPLHNAKCPLRSSQVLMSEIMKSRSCRPACVCVLSVARACCQVASTSPAPFQIATLPFLPSLGLCSSTWHNFWEPPEDWMGRENAGKDDVGQNLQVVHQSSSPWATDCPPLYILGRQLRRWQFYFATWKMAIFSAPSFDYAFIVFFSNPLSPWQCTYMQCAVDELGLSCCNRCRCFCRWQW